MKIFNILNERKLMYKPHLLGKIGELQAVKFIKRKGYKILAKNFVNSYGEIDIIAKFKNQYIFIEVKTKSNLEYGFPQEEVTKSKQEKIKKGALKFLRQNRIQTDKVRFDVIEVFNETINHIENAFY